MKVVLDANVVVAAFATQGLCRSLFELCLDRHEIIFGEELLEEIRLALERKIRMPGPKTGEVISFLTQAGRMVHPKPVPSDACSDPDDAKVLGTALGGEAEAIVTGDRDLLSLEKFRGVPILSPRAFWNRAQTPEKS